MNMQMHIYCYNIIGVHKCNIITWDKPRYVTKNFEIIQTYIAFFKLQIEVSLEIFENMYSTNTDQYVSHSVDFWKNNWNFLNLNFRPALLEQNLYYKLSFLIFKSLPIHLQF